MIYIRLIVCLIVLSLLMAADGTPDASTAVQGGGFAALIYIIWNGLEKVNQLIDGINRLHASIEKMVSKQVGS